MKNAAIRSSPYLRLLWKEYRAIRGFWVSLVALVVLIQVITIAFSQDARDSVGLIYNFALGAPAFFAIGSAGAAFAMEREEGTIEFLRAGPATSQQTFICKLVLTICATLAMFCLLLPIALWFMHGQLPDASIFHGMLGLWLVAALEAIAWGTLFSLLTGHPLLAICLAIAATSTFAHLLAWTQSTGPVADFSFPPYLQAVLWRLLLAGIVLIVDLYLGRQWLTGSDEVRRKRKIGLEKNSTASTARSTGIIDTKSLITKPDRSAMLGNLIWQHWRQSWKLMATMVALTLVAMLVSRMIYFLPVALIKDTLVSSDRSALPMIALAALMGCSAFIVDQEKRRYRFFAEHNIPPRYVWFTRHLLWMPVLVFATLFFCWWWTFSGWNWDIVWWEIQRSTNYWVWQDRTSDWRQLLVFPSILLLFACIAVSYAAGQWASMFVRSGLMAAFVGLSLAALLCGWAILMNIMQVSFWWSVWPIPLVLIFATWLRAPDWARENTRWQARFRAMAVVLIPAAALLFALPNHRVNQIPAVSAGFDPQKYIADITTEGLETGELYRRASDAYAGLSTRHIPNRDKAHPDRSAFKPAQIIEMQIEMQAAWLAENEKAIQLMLDAIERPTCFIDSPSTFSSPTWLRNSDDLIDLITTSAQHLEAEGKLIDAMERYFAGLKILAQWSNHRTSFGASKREFYASIILGDLRTWSARKGQTKEQLRDALKKVQTIDANYLQNDGGIKSNYIMTERFLQGDEKASSAFYEFSDGDKHVRNNLLWSRLMPWENRRALRLLNLMTDVALHRYRDVLSRLQHEEHLGVVHYLSPKHGQFPSDPANYFDLAYGEYGYPHRDVRKKAEWFETTNPNLRLIGEAGIDAVHELVDFEANRRATVLILSLQAYRLEHSKLPDSLSELVLDLGKLPRDPYSGQYFRYFPHGLQQVIEDHSQMRPVNGEKYTQPGIWCTGPQLQFSMSSTTDESNDSPAEAILSVHEPCYSVRIRPNELKRSFAQVWSDGLWFPIPQPQAP